MMKKQLVKRSLPLLAALFAAISGNAWTPLDNEIHVNDDGTLDQSPVVLHQPQFRNWLTNESYNSVSTIKSWLETEQAYTVIKKFTSGSEKYDRPYLVKIICGGQVQVFSNLCCGTTYDWSVGGKSGTFTTAAQAPRTLSPWVYGYVNTSGLAVNNVRDLGGWKLIGDDTKRTHFNVFFRSAHWDDYKKYEQCLQHCPMHSEIGINTEIDMRRSLDDGSAEVSYYRHRPDGAEIDDEYYTDESGNEFTTSPSSADGKVRYFNLNFDAHFQPEKTKTTAKKIREIFHILGQKKYHPVVFHCAGGKDRTAHVAILIEALCGMYVNDIYRDHHATCFTNGSVPNLDVSHYLGSAGLKANNPNFKNYGDSLAGRTRSYLEYIGVTSDEIAVITEAMTGETPDQVLARVNAARELNADAEYVSPAETDDEGSSEEQGETYARPGEPVTDADVLARGGDEVYRITDGGVDYFVHYFTSTDGAKTFVNTSGRDLSVRYLVVGGGGAGGDASASSDYGGAGGGGGGGVLGRTTSMGKGETWKIYVGKGGAVSNAGGHVDPKGARIPSEASAISNATATVDIATAPGGGAGACTSGTTPATAGAAGGGGAARSNDCGKKPGIGLFNSECDGVVYETYSGGVGRPAADGTNWTMAGGGGGAAANGCPGGMDKDGHSVGRSGDGGMGIISDISGIGTMYGAGGGGGGGPSVGPGNGVNNGGTGGTDQLAAKPGAPGTGGGGGGAGDDKKNSADGGSGIVIIRYAVDGGSEPQTTYWTVTFTTNGVTVSTASVEDGKKLSPSQIPSFTGGSWDSDPSAATITGNTTFNYTISGVTPEPQEEESWFENRKYDFLKSASDGVLGTEANWSAGSVSGYAIFRVYDKKAGDTAKDLSLSADWTVPEFDFGHPSYYPYTGALALGGHTLTCTKEFNVMTGNVARLTSGTIALTDTATAHVGWSPNISRLGGNAALILDGPDAAFVSTSANQLQIGSYPGPGCRVEVLNGARFESPLELGHAREKGGTWGNVFLASGAETVVNASSNSTYVGGFGWDDGVRTWGNSLILTDGAKMIAKTIYVGGGDARESSNNVFEVSNGATLEMTGGDRVVYISRNGCEGNMMKIANTTLNAEKEHGNFEIWMCPSNNGILQVSGTNTSVLLGRTQRFPAKTTLAFDLTGPQVGDKAMMTAVNYEFDPESTIRITSSADLAGVSSFAVKVLTTYSNELNSIPEGVITIDPAFEGRFVIDTTTDPKSLIVRYTGGEPAPEEAGWEDAETAGDTATAADVWGAAVPTDLAGVNAKRLAAWAGTQKVAFADAATIKSEAFLLNCANTDAAVEKAKDEFRFTSITPGEVPTIDGDFNGTVTVKGSTDLKTWNEKASKSDSFYKAVLEY